MAFLRRSALAFALVSAGLSTAPPTHAQDRSVETNRTSFDGKQTSDIEQIVHDYLVANPEVLVEAMDSLRAKQAAQESAAQKEAIAGLGSKLTNAPEGTVIGNPDGDVTVVEFFDYNCGYCRQALSDMDALVKKDPKVRFVLKEIAVLGPRSAEASHVSLAFRSLVPEKYAEFHRRLLGSRGAADRQSAMRIAADLGVGEKALKKAMDSDAVKQDFNEDNAMAEALAINGTPSYVVGDIILPGAIGVDNIEAAVSNMRRCGNAAC